MTQRDTIRLLRAIRDLSLMGYPYPDGSSIDYRLVLALGQIGGLASGALSEIDDGQAEAVEAQGGVAESAADQVGARRQGD